MAMKNPFLAGLALFSASAALAQSSVTINQSGDQSSNRAVVTQSGGTNSVVINQRGGVSEAIDSSTGRKETGGGNQISLRLEKNTQTTVNQHNAGPNSVEIWQDGASQATINQSSESNQNSIITHPSAPATPKPGRTGKRRKRG